MNTLSHLDEQGRARMVDVADKSVTLREALARGRVYMREETLRLISENRLEKGDVLGTARLAGIMAAKRTSELIPLCHPIDLSVVELQFFPS
ncbi:MAG: cyclic pyranopterin monophosphate synthase MoaC, partial [Nitrospinota bacterium]